MVTPGRSFSAGNQYRYGFNGKENDKDISGGAQDYGMRINDVRLGRFMSVDPLAGKYPELTTYQFAGNTPIEAIDLDGLEPFHMVPSRGASDKSVGVLWTKFKNWWNSSSDRSDKITKAYEHQLTGTELGEPGKKASNGAAVTWGIASFFRNWANGNSSTAGMSGGEEQTPATIGKIKITTPTTEDVPISTTTVPKPTIMYHYTNPEGETGIVSSQTLKPSLKASNPKDARYGDGQYLTDIEPGSKTPAQLSKAFVNNPWAGKKYSNFIAIDVTGLDVQFGRNNVYYILNNDVLHLQGRIVGSGPVPTAIPVGSATTASPIAPLKH